MRWKERQVSLEIEHKEEYYYSILELLHFILFLSNLLNLLLLLSNLLDLLLLLLLFLLVNKRHITVVT